MKNIRVATICHNEDDCRERNYRRIKLVLVHEHDDDHGDYYIWRCADDDADCNLGRYDNVLDAENALISAYSADCWALRAKWL